MPIFSQSSLDQRGLLDPRVLTLRGPLLKVRVQVHPTFVEQPPHARDSVVVAKEGLALIDTGASASAVDDSVIRGLGVSPVGLTYAGTANGARPMSLYPATLGFEELGVTLVFDRVVGCHIAPQGILALLGRDVLSRMLLVYNGPSGQIALAH